MTDTTTTPLGFVNRGIAAYRNDARDEARALFAQALLADSGNELAWIWFATVAADRREQRYAVDRALAINPESPARARLGRLAGIAPKVPDELAELDRPGLPPDLVKEPGPILPIPVPLPKLGRLRRSNGARTPADADSAPEPASEDAALDTPATTSAPRVRFTRKRGRNRWQWIAGALALLVLGGLLFTWLRPEPEPYRIAVVAPLTGSLATIGTEQVRAGQLAVDQINDRGGINGRNVELVTFDDQNDPAIAAQRAEQIVADDRVILIIGHNESDPALAAAPIYAEAGIPAISPASAADAITADNPWYFSVILPTTSQGAYMAGYTSEALGYDAASIVTTDGQYATGVTNAFVDHYTGAGATVRNTWQLDTDNLDQSASTIVQELATADAPGIVVLSMLQPEGHRFILAARRAGIDVPMLLASDLGFDDFPDLFENEPEEAETPGFFTEGLYAVSPLIYDSIGGDAVAFADAFRARHDTSPDWFGGKVYDAVTVGTAAIERASPDLDAPIESQRQAVRDALDGIDSTENGVPGLTGDLHFNDQGFVNQSLSVGRFVDGHLASEPVQYSLVTDPEHHDLEADRAANLILEIGDSTFRKYRVVYVGIDINGVSNLNTADQTFTADAFIWMRYSGDDSATDIVFTNASDPSLSMGEPLQVTESAGQTYAMYRVQGVFRQPLDFRDYPWDTHNLRIGFQNKVLDDHDIMYVADAATLSQPQAERLQSGVNLARPFNSIPSWEATRVWFSQESQTSRSAAQDPETQAPGYVEFSEFQVDMTFGRDVDSFLVKNLLPLALLALVTYISLFFPADQAGSRTGFAITSILTSSVMLSAISASLPDIGYTVAIEWGFYAYIGLSAVLVLFNIIVDRLYKQKRFSVVRRLDIAARVLYPTVVLTVIAFYAISFG